jgi:hypothetical protein
MVRGFTAYLQVRWLEAGIATREVVLAIGVACVCKRRRGERRQAAGEEIDEWSMPGKKNGPIATTSQLMRLDQDGVAAFSRAASSDFVDKG